MRKLILNLLLLPALILGCTESVPTQGGDLGDDLGNANILMMGDSLFAVHQLTGNSVGDALERALKQPVIDRSVIGARMIYALPISGSLGMKIARQYRDGPWDWIVLNGGGNDLWLGCGCSACDTKLDRLIAPGGNSGAIPDLLSKLRGTGARVIYVGYLRSPGMGSPVDHCRADGDALQSRIQRLAARDPGFTVISLHDLVPSGDRSYFALDMIHPSTKASRAIAHRIADVISTTP